MAALAFCVAVMIVAQVDADGDAAALSIVASQVTIEGRTSVVGPSLIKGIGQGVIQVRDKDSKNTVLLGTSTAVGSGEGFRVMPVEGSGFALTPSNEKGGLFVAGSTGFVGVNVLSKIREQLHVNGQLQTDKLIAGNTDKGPSVLLSHASEYHAVVLGKATANGAQKYSLGRGTTAQRSMTFHAAGIDEYDGAGKPPLMVYMSPEKVLVAVNADTGNTYASGTLALGGRTDNKKKWTSGSGSNLAVAGSVSMGPAEGQTGGASLFYTSAGSFSIRSNSFDKAAVVDTKFFISGASAKEGARVGINTVKPKTMLDVRGHMHIEANSQGDAHIYFPETGDEAGFYIRSADAPKVNDREKTRFYLSVDGKVGINTVTPEFGLELEAKTGVKTGGDIMIKKGNLHVYDGIRHTDKTHMLLMDSDNVLNGLHIEESLKISTSGKPSAIKSNHVHVQGTDNPVVRVETAEGGSAAVMLQSGQGAWTLSQESADKALHFKETHGGKMPAVMMDTAGRLRIGKPTGPETTADQPPEYGIQIETTAALGDPANSVMIKKGNLNIHGGISTREPMKSGESVTWRLHPRGISKVNGLGINEKLGIGVTAQPEFDFFMHKHRTLSLGAAGFLSTDGEAGTLSFNEYYVLNEGRSERRIHDKKHFSAAMRVTNTGKVEFDGTAAAGSLNTHKLLVVDPVAGAASFGRFLDIGFVGGNINKTPLRVKGLGGDGKAKDVGTISFGQTADAHANIGANDKEVFLNTQDNKKHIIIDNTGLSGKVAFGMRPMGVIRIGYGSSRDVTVITDRTNIAMTLTSNVRPGHTGSMMMKPGGDVTLTTTGAANGGVANQLEITEFHEVDFIASRCPKISEAVTIFDRGIPDGVEMATSKPLGTHFKSGKVGIGVDTPLDHLHVNGDTWIQGSFFVRKGFADGSDGKHGNELMEELSESLLEVGESTSDLEEDQDIVTMLEHMAKIVRKNKSRLQKQKDTMLLLEQQLTEMRSRL